MSQSDFQLALLLQSQFDHECSIDTPMHGLTYEKSNKKSLNRSRSLADPSWELIDPTPDIHILFVSFNQRFFWGKLQVVCVSWSKRMTSCAGICSYQGRGGLCHITLSEPLLKLRPRKDLIETLLHEMIHAYLFVTHNNKDRDGHGPEFHKHMYRINAEAGINITVYHSFHDEVRLYQQHWWRCDGPCQSRKPYFGMVRRATNRAPGPNDFWWAEHQATCGGKFIKVKEPEKKQKTKSEKQNKPTPSPTKSDIRNFFPSLNHNNSSATPTTSTATNSSNPKIAGIKTLGSTKPKNALANSSSTIVITKKQSDDRPRSDPAQTKPPPITAFSGKGQTLGAQNSTSGSLDYSAVRNSWLNKFGQTSSKHPKRPASADTNFSKRSKPEQVNDDLIACPVCQKKFTEAEINPHLDLCLAGQASGSTSKDVPSNCPVCDQFLKSDDFEEHVQGCLSKAFNDTDDVTLAESVPCLVCNRSIIKTELNTHLDECMSDNIFNNSGCAIVSEETSETHKNDDEKYSCPVCLERFSVTEMCSHLDKCLSVDSNSSFLDEPFC